VSRTALAWDEPAGSGAACPSIPPRPALHPALGDHARIEWYNPTRVARGRHERTEARAPEEEGSDNEHTVLEMNILAPQGDSRASSPRRPDRPDATALADRAGLSPEPIHRDLG